MADRVFRQPADGIKPGEEHEIEISLGQPAKPRIRRMTEEESKAWARGIHRACSNIIGVPALRYGYANLMPFVDEQCTTAYTDCHFRIGLSPDVLDPEKTTDEQRAIIILHETLHNIHRHGVRFARRNLPNTLVNFATDFEINSVIAEGVCGIKLDGKIRPNDSTQHWEWLIGNIEKIETEEEAAAVNEAYVNAKNPVKVGDNIYQGVLLPGVGKFWDLPANLTAEQYLSLMDWDNITEEDMLEQMAASDASQGSSNGMDSQDSTGEGEGQGQGNGSDSENDGNEGEGSDGSSPAGNAAEDAGADGGDASDGPDGEGDEGDADGDGSGSGSGNGTIKVKATRKYQGGTRIWQDHADGSRTDFVEENQWVDEIHFDGSLDQEVWDQVDSLGIHPIDRGFESKIREQIAHDIEEQKSTNNQGCNSMMAVLNYIAKGLRPPIVDWRKLLRQVIAKATQDMTAGRQDYTYRKRRRRSSGPVSGYPTPTEVIYPGLMAYLPRLLFALDTSGSMSQVEFSKALSEAEGILRETRSSIEFVSVDARAAQIVKAHTLKDITSNLSGGGGTDMRAALALVADMKPTERPDALVIATDGGFFWPEFIEALSMPGLEKTAVIVLVVYKFNEDRYYTEQSTISELAQAMRARKKDAYLVQAWV